VLFHNYKKRFILFRKITNNLSSFLTTNWTRRKLDRTTHTQIRSVFTFFEYISTYSRIPNITNYTNSFFGVKYNFFATSIFVLIYKRKFVTLTILFSKIGTINIICSLRPFSITFIMSSIRIQFIFFISEITEIKFVLIWFVVFLFNKIFFFPTQFQCQTLDIFPI
jgi:hypothetical protein